MLTSSRADIVKFVNQATFNMKLMPLFISHGFKGSVEEIANQIWSNVQQMQKTSQPIPGAPPRGLMPQTDDAAGWADILTSGKINWADPL